jgi:hypothetical protein
MTQTHIQRIATSTQAEPCIQRSNTHMPNQASNTTLALSGFTASVSLSLDCPFYSPNPRRRSLCATRRRSPAQTSPDPIHTIPSRRRFPAPPSSIPGKPSGSSACSPSRTTRHQAPLLAVPGHQPPPHQLLLGQSLILLLMRLHFSLMLCSCPGY